MLIQSVTTCCNPASMSTTVCQRLTLTLFEMLSASHGGKTLLAEMPDGLTSDRPTGGRKPSADRARYRADRLRSGNPVVRAWNDARSREHQLQLRLREGARRRVLD